MQTRNCGLRPAGSPNPVFHQLSTFPNTILICLFLQVSGQTWLCKGHLKGPGKQRSVQAPAIIQALTKVWGIRQETGSLLSSALRSHVQDRNVRPKSNVMCQVAKAAHEGSALPSIDYGPSVSQCPEMTGGHALEIYVLSSCPRMDHPALLNSHAH